MSAEVIIGFSGRKCSQCDFPLGVVWLKTPQGNVCSHCFTKLRLTDTIKALGKETDTPAAPPLQRK
jgi:uncharacterized paraquat-inducible protein A